MNLTLDSGRTVDLLELNQSRTYEGLIEGLPNRELNDRHLAELRLEYRRPGGLVIEPPQRPIEWKFDRPPPPGEHVALPSVFCVGRFRCFGDVAIWSGLTIAWFQDEFALPIDPSVLSTIRGLDWAVHADEYDP